MAMAMMEIRRAMNIFGHPGANIPVVCGKALMMSLQSSRLS